MKITVEKIKDGLIIFTDDIEDAITIATKSLGNNIAEIEDYFTFFNGNIPKKVRVFVNKKSKWFPKHITGEDI